LLPVLSEVIWNESCIVHSAQILGRGYNDAECDLLAISKFLFV